MEAKKKNGLTRFLIWRAKHISNKQFIYLLSMLIGFTSGVGAVVLKNATHFFQHLLEGRLVQYYHQAFYFVFPLLGLGLVYVIIKYGIRQKVSHGIPSTLFAMGISGPSTLSKTTTAMAPASSAFRTCGYGDGSVRDAGRDAFVGGGKKTSEKKLAGGRFSVLNEPW